jgi:predicted TIM-barrel fold metal-dependent hydrolase
MTALSGAIDYWCNAFTPDREAVWNDAIAAQGSAIKVHRDGDGFTSVDEMVERLSTAGFSTVILPVCDLVPRGDPLDFPAVAARPAELDALHAAHPGVFRGTWSIDPGTGMAGVERATEMLARPWCVGLHNHTHSWDRPFDHADFYPYYALAAGEDVPFVMQAGASGGRFPSDCGRPIGIDRPAIYFPNVRFVLSHLGWPWTPEAIAMAIKFPNVYLGTATFPPKRWPGEVLGFLAGGGRTKCLYGSGFPTTGHGRAAEQLTDLDLAPEVVDHLTRTNSLEVFSRLASDPTRSDASDETGGS